eukprot:7149847-Pyramimonas_sp.AAC.1
MSYSARPGGHAALAPLPDTIEPRTWRGGGGSEEEERTRRRRRRRRRRFKGGHDAPQRRGRWHSTKRSSP